jgi:hypothetical protein
MQNKLLATLLEKVIETNRIGTYLSAFRYGVDYNGLENMAVDLYNGGENLYHDIAYSNDDLKRVINRFYDAIKTSSNYRVYYFDDLVKIDKLVASESIAASEAFLLKQKYNINATISEVRGENL